MNGAGGASRFRELTSGDAIRVLERCVPREPLPPVVSGDPRAFHAGLPGYRPTRLAEMPSLAATLGLERLWVKDESNRFGLPAFKVLGAYWATLLTLCERFELDATVQLWPFDEIVQRANHAGIRLVAATDGNHGRAVARAATLFGCSSTILVPEGMAPSRIEAIAAEGAAVEVWAGSYDDAIEAASTMADESTLVIADTAWDGYECIPQWVSDGYSTIFHEVDAQLRRERIGPDIVFVQVGVGTLASSVIRHFAPTGAADEPPIVLVEPLTAACALASAEAGRTTAVPGPHTSIMAGLNAGVLSRIAVPVLDAGASACCAVPDELAEEAVELLAAEDVVAGETGAAGLAGLLALSRCTPDIFGGLGRSWRRPLLFVTEGVTDPVAHRQSLAKGRVVR